jgi:hypothetical protein
MQYALYLSVFTAVAASAILYQTRSPGDELVGSWEKMEVVCERDRGRNLSHTYDTDRADTISVLHFRKGDEGVLEEIHLAKNKSCTGRSEFKVEYLPEYRLKLVRGPMYWEGRSSRDLKKLGCSGESRKQVKILGYSYDPETETLRLAQKDLSRTCKKLVSVYKRS